MHTNSFKNKYIFTQTLTTLFEIQVTDNWLSLKNLGYSQN